MDKFLETNNLKTKWSLIAISIMCQISLPFSFYKKADAIGILLGAGAAIAILASAVLAKGLRENLKLIVLSVVPIPMLMLCTMLFMIGQGKEMEAFISLQNKNTAILVQTVGLYLAVAVLVVLSIVGFGAGLRLVLQFIFNRPNRNRS